MRVPLKWLTDYVRPGVPPKEVAHRLTMAGLEVTTIERIGGTWENVFVGKVVGIAPHPGADRLRLATVEISGETHTVVCGAPNVAAGQKIAFAKLGANLADGHTGKPFVLKAAKIRGVESAGMVCSEKELGLSDEHEGILVLDDGAPVGTPLSEVLGDLVFEVDMKPNRADGLSVLGVAREVAALTGGSVKEPSYEVDASGPPIAGRAEVGIEDTDLCSRYVATLIEGVRIGPSPAWMQERLRAAGMRPINNVVDVSNYVMLELGQPLHAFDYDTLLEGKIVVRRARPGETLTTLDGVAHTLTRENLLITDPRGPVAVAGVMGGLETEVTGKTTRILLESATFNAVSIRRTAISLKAQSEASRRFAWGVPPELAALASRRATQLLVEIAGGRAAQGVVDTYPLKATPVRVEVPRERLRQVLGIEIDHAKVVSTLESLGFQVTGGEDDLYRVDVPYWRRDVRIPDDIAEEVARLIGYDQIPPAPLSGAVPPRVPQPLRELRERVRDVLAAAGMQEVITYPLLRRADLERVVAPDLLAQRPPLSVLNPLNAGQEELRLNLRAGLLQAIAGNEKHRVEAVGLYEAARVYLPSDSGLPRELEHVAGAVSGRTVDRFGHALPESVDFFTAKAYVERLFERLDLEVDYAPVEEHAFVPGRTTEIRSGGKRIGLLGQVHPNTAGGFEVRQDVYLFEVVLDDVLPLLATQRRYQPLYRFPPVMEDLAVVVSRDVPAERVRRLISEQKLVVAVRVFDEYVGEPVPEGKKSLAFSLCYQAPDRTLTESEVARARSSIVDRLRRELSAALRS